MSHDSGKSAPPRPDKLIAIDLDGTLVGPDNSVADENLAAIHRAQQRGAAVVVFTGRPYVSADRLVTRIGLPPLPLVAFNGALIRWPAGGAILHSCPLDGGIAAEVVAECQRRELHLNYYLGDELYVSRDGDWARMYSQRIEIPYRAVSDLRVFSGQQPFKLLIVDRAEAIRELQPEWCSLWGDRLYVTRSMPEYLEMISPRASKGRALDWMLRFYGIERDRSLAIGDAMNDLPLLHAAACSAAMPEGEAAVRAVADFVPNAQATGVAQAIDWFLSRC